MNLESTFRLQGNHLLTLEPVSELPKKL